VPTAGDMAVWNYNTVAAGGKGVLYWQYAPEPAGLESPGFGLTGFDGGNNERSLAAGLCARELTDERLDSARRVLPVNAIYLSRKSEALSFCADRREDLYAGSAAGAYRAAYQARIPVRFVHEDYVDSLMDEGVRVLYVPMALSLSEREIAAFRRFVEAGGTLVGEAATGLYDESGTLDQASRALTELFGVDHAELEAFPDWGFADAAYEPARARLGQRQRRRGRARAPTGPRGILRRPVPPSSRPPRGDRAPSPLCRRAPRGDVQIAGPWARGVRRELRRPRVPPARHRGDGKLHRGVFPSGRVSAAALHRSSRGSGR
jgi:hypothetical protein